MRALGLGACFTAETMGVSCPVQAAVTEHNRLDSLNNNHLLLTVLETGKSESGMPTWLGSGETPFLAFFLFSFLF